MRLDLNVFIAISFALSPQIPKVSCAYLWYRKHHIFPSAVPRQNGFKDVRKGKVSFSLILSVYMQLTFFFRGDLQDASVRMKRPKPGKFICV